MTATALPLIDPVGLADRARVAQPAWEALPVRERLGPVRRLRRLLVEECDRLCAAAGRDLGKTAEEVLGGDILPLADACLFLEREAERLLRPRKVPRHHRPLWLWGQRDVVHRRPRGVVGVIGTWNYPLLLNGVQIVQALTAGNAVLWKPSEVAPEVAAVLGDLLDRCGLPPGLFQRLPATREAGRELTDSPVDHVIFTGAASTGKAIAAHLGERLISSTLELSGCDAMLVLDDADVALAARAAWFGAVLNRGQTCLAVRRVFVPRTLQDVFCTHLADLARDAVPCRLALSSQVEQAWRLTREALAGGARLLGGPADGDARAAGSCFPPTVLLDARPEMGVCQEASFAPLVAVLAYDRLEEALAMEGQCPYALGASVFTRDPRRAERLAPFLRTGTVTVNDVIVPTAHPATPFGGRGASGWGVTQGAEGLLEMTVPQVVSTRGGTFRPHYDMAAAGAGSQAELLRGMLESQHAPTLGVRLHGWRRLLGAFWRGSRQS